MWKKQNRSQINVKMPNKIKNLAKLTPKKCHVWIFLSDRGVENSPIYGMNIPFSFRFPHGVDKNINSKNAMVKYEIFRG